MFTLKHEEAFKPGSRGYPNSETEISAKMQITKKGLQCPLYLTQHQRFEWFLLEGLSQRRAAQDQNHSASSSQHMLNFLTHKCHTESLSAGPNITNPLFPAGSWKTTKGQNKASIYLLTYLAVV